MSCRSRFRSRAVALALSCAALPALADAPPTRAALNETVNVRLAQFRLAAIGPDGKAVPDLRPDEITVLEGGEAQKLAFFERLMGSAHDALWAQGAPPAAGAEHVRGHEGETAADAAPAVPAPPPVRRVLLAFDVRDSTLAIRERWRSAAARWVSEGMRPGDRVSVIVFHTYPEWLVLSSDDRPALLAAIDAVTSQTDAPGRDRAADMGRLVDVLRANCTAWRRDRGPEADCARRMARPIAEQWASESRESLGVLRQLVSQAGAVPGAKNVVLFSEGIVQDPGIAAFTAMQSVMGIDKLSASEAQAVAPSLGREVTELLAAARAAGITFQVIDTRTARGSNSAEYNLEYGDQLPKNALGVDPWAEMFDSSRTPLMALARETGGRFFAGGQKVGDFVDAAATGLDGVYAVGYYRSAQDAPGTLKVRIARRGVKAVYQSIADRASRSASQALRLDVAIGTPTLSGAGDQLRLPVNLLFPLGQLPLRDAPGGGKECILGVFVQALRPDGSIAAESFELATIGTMRPEEAWSRTRGRHTAMLDLPAGAYRVRVRVADDQSRMFGDRIVDLTVRLGAVSPGLAGAVAGRG